MLAAVLFTHYLESGSLPESHFEPGWLAKELAEPGSPLSPPHSARIRHVQSCPSFAGVLGSHTQVLKLAVPSLQLSWLSCKQKVKLCCVAVYHISFFFFFLCF